MAQNTRKVKNNEITLEILYFRKSCSKTSIPPSYTYDQALCTLKYIYFKNGLLNRLKLQTFVHHIVGLVVGKHGVITMRLLVKVRVTFHNVVVVSINQ